VFLRAGNTIKRGQNQVIDILQQSGSESPPPTLRLIDAIGFF